MTTARWVLALAALGSVAQNPVTAGEPLALTPWNPSTLQIAGEYAGDGRRATPAPVLGFDATRIQDEYLVVIRSDSTGERKLVPADLPITGLPGSLPPALREVMAEAIGQGALVHEVYQDGTDSFYATLSRRAVEWLAGHPDVEIIEARTPQQFAKPPKLRAGGLEFVAAGAAQKGTTSVRVLINGEIAGFGNSGYRQPTLLGADLIGHVAPIVTQLGYRWEFDGASRTLTFFRLTENREGVRQFSVRDQSTTLTLWEPHPRDPGRLVPRGVTMPAAARLVNGAMMAPMRRILENTADIVEWDADTASLQATYFGRLDTGIYFLGVQQNSIATDSPGAQKYVPGQPNPFFRSDRPTIIYAHGWANGSVVANRRESLLLTAGLNGGRQNVQNYWKLSPEQWNVGIFYWNQLSDDDINPPLGTPVLTEQKIYDANSYAANGSFVGMRWKAQDGSFSFSGSPTVSAAELYRRAYRDVTNAMASNREVRLIGNSLGANLTMSMLRLAYASGNRLPSRVTLHDPYFGDLPDVAGRFDVPFGFASTNRYASDTAQLLSNRGIAIEYFLTSIAGARGYNRELADIAALTLLEADFVNAFPNNIATRHVQPTRIYLWSYAFTGGLACTTTASNARTCPATLRARMGSANRPFWRQLAGATAQTTTPADDSVFTPMVGSVPMRKPNCKETNPVQTTWDPADCFQ